MGWGNPRPLADLKRQHSAQLRMAARTEAAEAAIKRVKGLIDRHAFYVPTALVRAAIADPACCALCLSPYAECAVHPPGVVRG